MWLAVLPSITEAVSFLVDSAAFLSVLLFKYQLLPLHEFFKKHSDWSHNAVKNRTLWMILFFFFLLLCRPYVMCWLVKFHHSMLKQQTWFTSQGASQNFSRWQLAFSCDQTFPIKDAKLTFWQFKPPSLVTGLFSTFCFFFFFFTFFGVVSYQRWGKWIEAFENRNAAMNSLLKWHSQCFCQPSMFMLAQVHICVLPSVCFWLLQRLLSRWSCSRVGGMRSWCWAFFRTFPC